MTSSLPSEALVQQEVTESLHRAVARTQLRAVFVRRHNDAAAAAADDAAVSGGRVPGDHDAAAVAETRHGVVAAAHPQPPLPQP